MEQALMAVCKDIRLGKILIQTNHDTGEPEVLTDLLYSLLITWLDSLFSICSVFIVLLPNPCPVYTAESLSVCLISVTG